MPTKQFRAVQKEATNKPKSKTQCSDLTKKSVTKVNKISTHPTVSRCSPQKNCKLKSQRKSKESDVIPLKSPDTTASGDKQSLSPNSDSSCCRVHRLTTDKKAKNRKSTDQSKALQNGEASSPLLEAELAKQRTASCGSKGTEKSCRARRSKRQKKRKKLLTEQHPEEDYGLRVDLEKSADEQSFSHKKINSSPKDGNPPILCCNNNDGSKNSTTSKHDNGSSSQTGSNSSSKNTSSSSSSSSSSNGDGASASGCGGSGGRDDDERNKDNHRIISSESSTEEESSDNEEASKDVEIKVINFTITLQLVFKTQNVSV